MSIDVSEICCKIILFGFAALCVVICALPEIAQIVFLIRNAELIPNVFIILHCICIFSLAVLRSMYLVADISTMRGPSTRLQVLTLSFSLIYIVLFILSKIIFGPVQNYSIDYAGILIETILFSSTLRKFVQYVKQNIVIYPIDSTASSSQSVQVTTQFVTSLHRCETSNRETECKHEGEQYECSVCPCYICAGPIDYMATLKCGHQVHLSCMIEWTKQTKHPTCPMCRKEQV